MNDYPTPSDIHFSFDGSKARFEKYVRKLCLNVSLELDLKEDDWEDSRVAGCLRNTFSKVEQLAATESQEAEPRQVNPQASSSSGLHDVQFDPVKQFIQDRVPPMLTRADIESLTDTFQQSFTSEVIVDQTMPARDYLRRIKHKGNTIGNEWMPWTSIVSKAQEDEILRTGAKRRRATPISDGPIINSVLEEEVFNDESSIKNGAMDISNMLATRSHAYAMLGVAHLSLTKNLDAKMMSAYGKKFEATASHRAINPQELQKADQLIWDEIFRLSRQKDWTVDRAIFEVTENGFTERKLEPVPCIPRATTDLINSLKGSVGKGKGNERKRSNAQISTSAQDDQSWTRVEKKRKGKAKGKGGKGKEEKPKRFYKEFSEHKVNGVSACMRFNLPGKGCNGKGCRLGHCCAVKMPNGAPCGQKHPAFKHDQVMGINH